MIDLTPLFRLISARRRKTLARLDVVAAQEQTLLRLVRSAAGTDFGREHGFTGIRGVDDYQARVPLRYYEDFWQGYWKSRFPVVENATWPGRIPYFAVTSGTSTGRTKYIPLTKAILRNNTKAGLDLIAYHLAARPHSRLFAGKSFMLGGSTALVEEAPGIFSGDLSGIVTHTLPFWARPFSFPDRDLALLADWEEKLERLAAGSLDQRIRTLAGVPSWLLILLERVRTLRGRGAAANPYPELELLVHGGVNFEPYRPRFEHLLSGSHAELREVYPASEGFLAAADRGEGEGLRLNLDHGIFYEFVPLEELEAERPTRHWVGNLETGVNYAVAMTTPAGLWSYILGDTVRFLDRVPPRLLVTGRTAYGMSAFGEHLIGEEIERAVAAAAEAIGADISDYSMGALHPTSETALGRHRYYVEFSTPPPADARIRFAEVLDRRLCELNDDYLAHRSGGVGMDAPEIRVVAPGSFAAWMKARGRLGGQNKVPRILNAPEKFAELEDFLQPRVR